MTVATKSAGATPPGACGEVFSFAGVDGFGCDPYTPVHRRAANGVGGLLLHLLTIGGVLSLGFLGLLCCWVGLGAVFFDK